MKSNENEVAIKKLAEYTATRILDDVLAGETVIDYSEPLTGAEIYKTLKKGTTRDMIFNNMEFFDLCLTDLIFDRIDYLCAEGLVVFDNPCYRIPTDAEMKEFLTVE